MNTPRTKPSIFRGISSLLPNQCMTIALDSLTRLMLKSKHETQCTHLFTSQDTCTI